MLTSVIIVEKYLTLNLRKEANFIFLSHIRIWTTVICPSFIAKTNLKNYRFYQFIRQA